MVSVSVSYCYGNGVHKVTVLPSKAGSIHPDNNHLKQVFSATAQSQAKRPKMDGTCLNTHNYVVVDSSTDLSKPLSIVKASSSKDNDQKPVKEFPTRRDSNGNEVIEIQPESPKSDNDQHSDPELAEVVTQSDDAVDFYMPSK